MSSFHELDHILCLSQLGCVWFEYKSRWGMAIHGFSDMNIHVVCLLDGWDKLFFCLVRWMSVDQMRVLYKLHLYYLK